MEMTNKATWIWYPGDYEIWLGNQMNNRRTERGSFYPPYLWRIDSHFPIVEFRKGFHLEEDTKLRIYAEGSYNVVLDGVRLFGAPKELDLKAGNHGLVIQVYNQATPPTLLIKGDKFGTGADWEVCASDKKRVNLNGRIDFEYVKVGSWNFDSPLQRPSEFKLQTMPLKAVSKKQTAAEFPAAVILCFTFHPNSILRPYRPTALRLHCRKN